MTVTRFQCTSAERLALLLANDPTTPYRGHRARIGRTRYDKWASERGARALCNAAGAFETPTGAIGWNHLAWDSEIFGFPAARIELLVASGGYTEARLTASVLLARTLEECAAAGIRHLVARIDSPQIALAHALEESGFELIDGIQTFSLALEGPAPPMPPGTRLAIADDADDLAAIARTSFVYDRFHNDVAVGRTAADNLHDAWIRNSVAGQAANAVIVSAPSSPPDAFVTIKLDDASPPALGLRFASIPLVATAFEARGKGAARRATEAALAWCHGQGVEIVEVGTQISNIPAARLYQAAGFRTTAISLTYRKIIDS